MKKTTAKTKPSKKITKTSASNAHVKKRSVIPLFQTGRDVRDAVLVVSIAVNIFMLCIWVVLQQTSIYDQALFNFFIHR